MKIITIGDIHGIDLWKPIYEHEEFDLFMFIGDYLDSFDIGTEAMLRNFKDICELDDPRVIRLLGNHEMHYMFSDNLHKCSGFRPEMYWQAKMLLDTHKEKFKLSHQIDNYLWSHAGIHIGWYKLYENQLEALNIKFGNEKATLSDKLNLAFDSYKEYIFNVGARRGGRHNVGGPLWLDKANALKKPIKGYHQIVGHTALPEIKTHNIDNNTSITFIDTLGISGDYYILEI